MNRWKMHKLGFLNFWLYDQEEFLLENGRILLRGNNGPGKSIAKKSSIPLTQEANGRQELLDPLGFTEKKRDFYLLGALRTPKRRPGICTWSSKRRTWRNISPSESGCGQNAGAESTNGDSTSAMAANWPQWRSAL